MEQKNLEIQLKKENKDAYIIIAKKLGIAILLLIGGFAIMMILGALIGFDNKLYSLLQEVLGTVLLLGVGICIISVIGGIRLLVLQKRIYKYITGQKIFKFPSCTIENAQFKEELETGLFPAYIRINGKIYYVEVQLPGPHNADYSCYINYDNITGKENFLNYEIDGKRLGDFPSYEFLSYCGGNPITLKRQ